MRKLAGKTKAGNKEGTPARYVRASELARWAYCQRAWWLEYIQGHPSMNLEAMERGRTFHDRHGRATASAARYRRWALWAFLAGAALLLVLAGLSLLGPGG